MKRLFFVLLILGLLPFIGKSQSWKADFYLPNEAKGSKGFFDIQKDFNTYWSDYDLKSGYYYENGVKKKAAGWKQFKRWEWFWETRVDQKTGQFPSVSFYDIQKSFLKANKSKSDLANWQSMGPSSSKGGYAGIGRVNCVAFHPTDVNTIFIGAPSGGLWKTTDGGNSWDVLTDTLPVLGVSEIFIPNDYETSKTIYIATGDRDGGDNYSIGVLKSTNDGKTWDKTGLVFNVANRYRITRMLAHPTQQNIIYASTNGGIYKTSNGGTDWSKVADGVFFDMEFKPTCEDTVLFAVTADYNNSPKIYKTKDAGANWTVVHTFSTSAYRVELDVAKSAPSVVYALASNKSGGMVGVYKSTNSGETFTEVFDGSITGNNLLNWGINSSESGGQGWYDLTLSVSPTNENTLYLGGVNSWKSTNGGASWTIANHWYGASGYPAVHADKHYMEFQNNTTFFEANDGGLYKTTNGGQSWVDLTNTMVISQMYKLGVSATVKDEVITGLQDNGSKLISSSSWKDVKGGDGMECLIDYTNVNVQYATYVNGQIDRTTDRWLNPSLVVDITENIPGGPNGAWVTPYALDPKDNQTLYVGYSDVWKTTDRGDSWSKISTINLTNKIRSLAIAPSNNKYLYITDLSTFYRTADGGASWENLTSKLPSTNNSITYITVDNLDPLRVWITLGGYNGYKVFESTDGGDSWIDISSGLPPVPANTIVQNILSKTQQLYVGTDIGVFIKDGNSDWTLFSKNLPSVIVSELEIYYDKGNVNNCALYAATYGRGLWKSTLAPFELPEIKVNYIEGPFYVSNDSSATITLNFTTEIAYSSNTFTAYLSDKNGDFSNPTIIGTKVSDIERSIKAVIPAGTESGDNYLVKITSSSPAFESNTSNSFRIVLDNQKPTITISSTVNETTSLQFFNVSIQFSEKVVGFDYTDINVTNASIISINTNNAPQYYINLSPTASGRITVDVPANIAYDFAGNLNLAADQWTINYIPTGINQLVDYGVNVYPNPTDGLINFSFDKEFSDVNVTIQDLLGRVLMQKSMVGHGVQHINLSGFSKGVYIVKMSIDKKEFVSKILVE